MDTDGVGGLGGPHRLRPEQDPDRHRRADDRGGGGRRARRRPRLGRAGATPAPRVHVDLARVNARVKQLAPDQTDDIAQRLEKEGVRRRARPGPARRRRHASSSSRPSGEERHRGGRRAPRHRRRAADAARRRSPTASGSSTWEQVYDLTELPPASRRGRLGGHRRRVRQRLPRARRRGHAGLEPRPGAARRGRRRGGGARGGAHPPWHAGARALADGVGDPRRRQRHRHPHRRAHGRGLPLHPRRRLGAQHRATSASRPPASTPTTGGSSPSTGSPVRAPAGCTPPATAPAS